MTFLNSRADIFTGISYRDVRKIIGSLNNYARSAGLKKNFLPPGFKLVIKPNWVMHINPAENTLDALVTNTALIAAVIDWVALHNPARKGSVVIADAPLQSCKFGRLQDETGMSRLIKAYNQKYKNKIRLSVVDLRKTIMVKSEETQINVQGDPSGYTLINLGSDSLFTGLEDTVGRLRVTNYNPHDLLKHHSREGKHEYLISNTILNADFVLNLPKAKTHIKAGLTGALKNMVGINGHKEYLPHHTQGSLDEGGDQFRKYNIFKTAYNQLYDYYWGHLDSLVYPVKIFLKYFLKGILLFAFITSGENHIEGSWSGNYTVARMTVDLNNILYFWNRSARKLARTPQRKILTVVDGIISGQGQGPLRPTAKNSGFILVGTNPLVLDQVLAKLIGFREDQIPTLNLCQSHPMSRFAGFVKPDYYLNGKKITFMAIPDLKFILPRYW